MDNAFKWETIFIKVSTNVISSILISYQTAKWGNALDVLIKSLLLRTIENIT